MAAVLHPKNSQSMLPTERESHLAHESSLRLSPRFRTGSKNPAASQRVTLRIEEDGGQGETVDVPIAALRMLLDILGEMAGGNSVTLVPSQVEMTTQQAAHFLNVSRPYLIGLLESGKISFHKAGTHRRILFQDLRAYKTRTEEARRETLQELTSISQELGIGY